MNLYYEMLKNPVFSVEDVNAYYGNIESARSAVKRLRNDGLVSKIRNNMYTCISGETGQPVASRFQIASRITATSYISHHTALEYYGITDQIYYDVFVSSETGFRSFEFGGYTYYCISAKNREGVEIPSYGGGVLITDMEKTLVDSIKDMDKIGGVEEIVQCIECMSGLREERLIKYMESYHNQFLYQKMGYLLSVNKEKLGLTDSFFDVCKSRMGKSKRYLTKDIGTKRYDSDWKLVVPADIFHMKNGVNEYADI